MKLREMSVEGRALLAVAKGQGALLRATKELLKEDKHDGLMMAKVTSTHEKAYREIYDRVSDRLSPDEKRMVMEAAGEPEDIVDVNCR